MRQKGLFPLPSGLSPGLLPIPPGHWGFFEGLLEEHELHTFVQARLGIEGGQVGGEPHQKFTGPPLIHFWRG